MTRTDGRIIYSDVQGYKTYEVFVDVDDIIALDYEGFLDLLSEKATGHGLLMDISHETTGLLVEPRTLGTLKIEVTGYLDQNEEEWRG